jgi:hypothetical protein
MLNPPGIFIGSAVIVVASTVFPALREPVTVPSAGALSRD